VQEDIISIKGARTHNLKNINVDIPRGKFVVITGVSGSGKSSLAFDTIYAEGQRRYVESLSAYARQFLHMMDKPDVDNISGLSPAISIDQKTRSHNPRSTVGTVTEIYDYLRLLFARVGIPYSPTTGLPIEAQSIDQMVEKVANLGGGTKFYVLAPVIRDKKGEYKKDINEYRKQGFQRVIVDEEIFDTDFVPNLERYEKHTVSLIIDRLVIPIEKMLEGAWRTRLVSSLEVALRLTNGIAWIKLVDNKDEILVLSEKFACPVSGFTIEEIEPRLFSFNNPQGACPQCNGLGIENKFDVHKIINWSLSIKQGAIISLTDEKKSIYKMKSIKKYYQQLLETVAKQFNIPLTTPFSMLSEEQQNIILNGTGDVVVPMKMQGKHKDFNFNKPFEGVLNIVNRRFNESEEENWVREMLTPIQTTCPCSKCKGLRLKQEALCVKVNEKNIAEISKLSVKDAINWFENITLSKKNSQIAERIIKEIKNRLIFLKDVGLNYLTLSRRSETLSGGESQRIRLASQIGSGLTGVLYVLDEPSIGLHQRDNERLLGTIKNLRDLGNSVIVVEHDEDAIRNADFVVDMGPHAGVYGGEVIAIGTVEEILKSEKSITADYLTGRKKIEVPEKRRPINPNSCKRSENDDKSSRKKLVCESKKAENENWRGIGDDKKKWGDVHWLSIENAKVHNLKNVSVDIPLGRFVCVTGISGSGKSSLILDGLFKNLTKRLRGESVEMNDCSNILGAEYIDKIIDIDQSSIGKTPRSNPATYVGFFTTIREWFATLPESKARGYTAAKFSFNIKGGRCEACQGDGLLKIEMHFLPDVYVECDQCHGKRYNKETLLIQYKEKNISDILNMSIDEGVKFFENQVGIWRKLKCLQDVGLGYLSIGHPATSLSGGEAQRIKVAKELSRVATGLTLYILDEPTTGLHFEDIRKLVEVLNKLVDHGNSVLIIEHNLDIIKVADWIIDLGPEGGYGGGRIIAQGPPEEIIKISKSYTGKYLKNYI
jgi:excinuclease ABC subunit A